jgi:hypothetical protein
VKLSRSLWKTRSRNGRSPTPVRALHLEYSAGGPGVDGRIGVAEAPLVRRQLPVGMHVPLPRQEHELALGKCWIDHRGHHAVEGKVPGCEPRVLPGVRHGEHIGGVELAPCGVATHPPLRGWRRVGRIAVQPLGDVVRVELTAPDQSGQGLSLDAGTLGVEAGGDGRKEGVGLRGSDLDDRITVLSLHGRRGLAIQAEMDGPRFPGGEGPRIVECGLGGRGVGRKEPGPVVRHHGVTDGVLRRRGS